MARAAITPNGSYFYWNLDKNVGRNQPNLLDDVELVRFAYVTSLGVSDMAYIAPLVRVMRKNGPYGPDLQAVIDAHQKHRGGKQDGYITAVPNAANYTGGTYDGTHTYMHLVLNNWMRLSDRTRWPRIDNAPDTGAAITATVRGIMQPN